MRSTKSKRMLKQSHRKMTTTLPKTFLHHQPSQRLLQNQPKEYVQGLRAHHRQSSEEFKLSQRTEQLLNPKQP